MFLLALKSVQIWSPRPKHKTLKLAELSHLFGSILRFQTYLKYFNTTIIQHQYKPFTTLLQLKSGDLVATKTDDPLDILGVYAYILIINANIGE